MNVLITGVCGFVGSTIARSLLETRPDVEVVGIDSLVRPGSELNRAPLLKLGVNVVQGDIRSPSDLEFIPAVDWVVDAAANPSVMAGVDGQTSSRQLVENNLVGTINLLEFCKQHSAGFILLSTSRVYSIDPLSRLKLTEVDGAFEPDPQQEFCPGLSPAGVSEDFSTTPPVSLYGSTKVASEQLALEYGKTFEFPVWINRCGVLAGAGQFGHPTQGIFSFWIHSFRERVALKYIGFGGNGHQVRDCLHPRDLVWVLNRQFDEPFDTDKPRTANFGGGVGNSISLKKLSTWCCQKFEPMEVSRADSNRPFDIGWLVLDSDLASKVWNWRPTTGVREILEEIAEFAKSHPNWLMTSNPQLLRQLENCQDC